MVVVFFTHNYFPYTQMQAYPSAPLLVLVAQYLILQRKKFRQKTTHLNSNIILGGLGYANVCASCMDALYGLLELFDLYHDEWVRFKFVAFSPYRFFHGIFTFDLFSGVYIFLS